MLKTDLYAHQRAAFEKLKYVTVSALFMDMGTGKSRTTLELINYRKDRISNVIWFCPVSVMLTLKKEITKHSDFECSIFKDSMESFITICGIQSIVSDRIYFELMKIVNSYTYIIVDESLFIKTHNALRTKRITKLGAYVKYKSILNGTPISKNEADLFSQFRFLSPKILGFNSFYSFAANHLVYSDKYPNKIVRVLDNDVLAKKIAPYSYQVTKEECFDLPDKVHNTLHFSISRQARIEYNVVKENIFEKYDQDDEFFVFRLFNNLQKIACGFSDYFEPREFDCSEKIEALTDYLSVCQNEKVIILCKFTKEIERLKDEIKDRQVFMYYGKKKDSIDDFLLSENGVLIGNHKCLGFGHNLQECNRIVFYSNTFNFAEVAQSEDRIYRPGQKKTCFITTFIASSTIDEFIEENLIRKKWKLSDVREEINKVKDKKEFLSQIVGGFEDAKDIQQ